MKRPANTDFVKRGIFAAFCIAILGCCVKGIMDVQKYYGSSRISFAMASLFLLFTAGTLILAYYVLSLSIKSSSEFRRICGIADKMNVLVLVWSGDLSRVYCNKEFTETLGYTVSDLGDNEILKRILPEGMFNDDERDQFIASFSDTFYIKAKDGSGVMTAWKTAEMFRNKADGSVLYMSLSPNLNDRIKMQNELLDYSVRLEESEQRYALTMKLTDIGVLLRHSDWSTFYTNENLRSMLGFPKDQIAITKQELLAKIHPSDLFLAESFAYSTTAFAEDDVHSVELRAISADGSYHWYNLRYRITTDRNAYIKSAVLIDINAEKQKDLIIENMAYIDELTQIGNRNKFISVGKEIMTGMKDDHTDHWVIVFDIDEIHLINDSCGYSTGSDLIRRTALIAMASIPYGSLAVRLGGDNFALMVKCDGNDELPVTILDMIQSKISELRGSGLENHSITISAGYCKISDSDSDDFTKVLDLAELAHNNNDGTKNTYLRYTNELRANAVNISRVEREIESGLENNEFVLYYQPKIDLADGRIIGMEALIRWIKPDGTMVAPMEFIPIAERSMIITKISRFVLTEACRQNKAWQDEGLPPMPVSINLTAIDFYRTNVTKLIRDTLESTGLEPRYLDIELTESTALKDISHSIEQMNEIRKLGVCISMDDFGTGYSSLSYIQKLPITLLKLDRSFVMFLETDEVSREIVSAVVRIAKSKKIDTIAEGIESQEQADILRDSGCDYAQGFFFGRPMPADEFRRFLIENQGIQK